jgi:hypothetical protein
MYDPQLGRFGQIDPLAEVSHVLSPYNFAANNPILRNDPLGLQDTVFQNLPTATVTAAAPGSLTYGLNHLNFAGIDAWAGMMMNRYHHSAKQINSWAVSNNLLDPTRLGWILNATTASSQKYRSSMAASWNAQGKVYKFFLISALSSGAGEVLAGLTESADAIVLEDATEDVTEDAFEEATSVYHKGELDGGTVSSTKALSTGTDRAAVEALERPGQVWEFKIPNSKLFEWRMKELTQTLTDVDKATGVMNQEIRFSPKLADQLNNFMVK